MSESPTFWQRNSGAALLGVATYLIVTPAFGFSIDQELTEGHGVSSSDEEPPGFLDGLPLVGNQLSDLGLGPKASLISSAVDSINDALASHGVQIALPDPADIATELAGPAVDGADDTLGSIEMPSELEALQLHGTQIDLESAGSIALVGELIDVVAGGATLPTPPTDLVVTPPKQVGIIAGNVIKAVSSLNPVETDEIDTFDIDVIPGVVI